jgi:LPXTG-motif cell wall-anchored protein
MLKQKAAQLKQDQVKALSNKAWSATQMHLPQTSTQSRFYMLFGLVFLALAGLFGLPIFIGHK